MNRIERIEEERKDFIQYKKCISCDGDPKRGDTVWNIIMEGPKDSPYMGGKFKIKITFPNDYPTKPPVFEFLTPIIHINISGKTICLGSLKDYEKYNSNLSVLELLSQIFMMLTSPNEQSAYSEYYDLYFNHYAEYLDKAREKTREFAM
jgi:ubiquitin-conjugating enzyme E2 D/E